ncbi:hypothetical protein BH20GEM1_BH20GEM1_22790 [soil metagenome]
MTPLVRSVAKLFLVSQISFALACSDMSPGGPDPEANARFSGLLTQGSDASGQAFRAATPMAGARLDLVSDGMAVATLHTGATGAFSATVPSGSYTVQIATSAGPPLKFALDLSAGGALFAAGRVDQTPAGAFTLNVQVFRDADADAEPDDAFRLQVLDREQGDDVSGFEDIVASTEEAQASVTLCHVPPGNPDAAHTVDVGAPAVPAHLAHGDTEGACADDAGDEEEEGEEDPEEEQEGGDGEAKVLVCHVPPGNPDNPHTIEVGESAVPAHRAHGDTEGACIEATPPAGGGTGDQEGGEEGGEG